MGAAMPAMGVDPVAGRISRARAGAPLTTYCRARGVSTSGEKGRYDVCRGPVPSGSPHGHVASYEQTD